MGSTPRSTPKSKDTPADGVVKHRACDECRSRKLACSKEHDGCTRCRREGVKCIYSPQKPMGRPRKRRPVEPGTPSSTTSNPYDQHHAQQQYEAFYSHGAYGAPVHGNDLGLDPNFAFMDSDNEANLEFLDLLTPSFALPPMDDEAYANAQYADPNGQPAYNYGAAAHFSFGADMLGRIDFADTDSADDDAGSHFADSLPLSGYGMPSLSPGPSMTPESSPSPRPYYHNTNCRCLSSMYLAMDALANIPTHSSMAAMKVARNACRVAHDVIHCEACSLPWVRDPNVRPPVQAFQNLMILGGLIPAIANAYAHIVDLVDAEAAKAKRERRRLRLTFEDAGGFWGALAEEERNCGLIQMMDNRELDADNWRLSLRGLLKTDIYGYDFDLPPDRGGHRINHQGLKDVIDALEDRSRIRHAKVDEMLAQGTMAPDAYPHNLLPVPHTPGQVGKKNCTHIIELARGALERLVIA